MCMRASSALGARCARSAATSARAAARSFATSAARADAGRTTHFGFREVPEDEKVHRVGEVFHRVAGKYDLMNDLMSGTLHRFWKDHFVAQLGPAQADEPLVFLDVAGGTGDVAFRIAKALRDSAARAGTSAAASQVLVCDINESMLGVGRERAASRGLDQPGFPSLDFVQGDAERLPFEDASVDAYTIAFGIRNVTHVQQALNDAYRVLKPGGRFMCLEFSHVEDPLLRLAYDQYSMNVIPALGEAVAGDRDSYQYLVESIRKFPAQRAFAAMMQRAGFSAVTYDNLTFGVVAVHSGFKLA